MIAPAPGPQAPVVSIARRPMAPAKGGLPSWLVLVLAIVVGVGVGVVAHFVSQMRR